MPRKSGEFSTIIACHIYPQRIEAMERNNTEYRELFRYSDASSQEMKAEDQLLSDDVSKRFLRNVLDAENKSGVISFGRV